MFDLSDFVHGMIVGAKWVHLNIPITADFMRLSHTTVSRVYSESCNKEKSSE